MSAYQPAQTFYYHPSAFFTSSSQYSNRALLILNQPLQSIELLDRIWRTCSFRACADGGANRLHDLLLADPQGGKDKRGRYLPDAIHGDLDSLRSDVRGFYTGAGVSVSRDPDQYSTDFGKNVKKILSAFEPSSSKSSPSSRGVSRAEPYGDQPFIDVIVLSSIAGRLDQGLGTLHEISREQERRQDLRFWLVTESSLSFILPGSYIRSVIDFRSSGSMPASPAAPEEQMEAQGLVFTKNVGIIPIYGPSQISTSGLEWDVREWYTRMGGDVSTSNHIVSSVVEVLSSERVLFTVERRSHLPLIQQ